MVKKLPANAGDVGLIPGSGRSPGEGNGTYSSTLAWRILWTEEPGGLTVHESYNPLSQTTQQLSSGRHKKAALTPLGEFHLLTWNETMDCFSTTAAKLLTLIDCGDMKLKSPNFLIGL